jgi:hypothetical protein
MYRKLIVGVHGRYDSKFETVLEYAALMGELKMDGVVAAVDHKIDQLLQDKHNNKPEARKATT